MGASTHREDEGDVVGLVNARLLRFGRSPGGPISRATALLIDRGAIGEIGDDPTIADLAKGRGEVVDLSGAFVAPGFIDAHIHAFDCALSSLRVSCLPPSVVRLNLLMERMSARAASTPEGAWVVGSGYDDRRLAERRHPTRLELDRAVPNHPALVTRSCGHMSVANSRALELAGVDDRTPDPAGGAIVRDPAGEPTGLLLETAQGLVEALIPPVGVPEIARALQATGREILARGITTIGEALLGAFHPQEPRIWSDVFADGWAGPNVRFLADPETVGPAAAFELPVIGTKLFADGVIAGRTAAVSSPFEGGEDSGMLIHTPDELTELVGASIARGLRVGIHAMGDLGIATAIDAIERAERASGDPAESARMRRHRIEHCTLPGPRSLRRMQELGLVPLPQPVFLFAEGEAYRDQLGDERCAQAYPLRTMIELGLRPALSSDAPATSWEDPIDPWLGIRTAVTRRTWAGSQLGSAETISLDQAMAGYTADGAFALGLEQRTGSIEVGKDADLVVFPEDPLAPSLDGIGGMLPTAVLVGGRLVAGSLG
ncbi:MAG: amidohydrolase [Solirubrobacterales bacterium]